MDGPNVSALVKDYAKRILHLTGAIDGDGETHLTLGLKMITDLLSQLDR
jgi:hypothetical protein